MPGETVTREMVYLLPGLLCDDSIWAHQIAVLRERCDVAVADFRSFDSLRAMAASVLETAPGRFSVAGHSMGARVALEMVRLAPERIARLALLDTGIHEPRPGEPAQRQVLIDLADSEGMDALADRWLPPMVHPARRDDAAFMGGLRQMVRRMSPAIYRNQITALLGRKDAANVLPLLRMPVLIGVGRQDEWSPLAQHETILAGIPHASFVVFENSGHMAPLEAPEAVTQAMREWMAMPVQRSAPPSRAGLSHDAAGSSARLAR